MAEAHGKLTKTPGICFVSRGPGAANAMIGIHTAFQDSTPLILFVGQISRSDRFREAFQELDYRQVYGSVAKDVLVIDQAERIPELLQQAWNTALGGRPGPVIVELPEDMLVDQVSVFDKVAGPVVPSSPGTEGIAQVIEWLQHASRPLVICGGAGWTSQASEWLTKLSEHWQVPVITSFRRSDSFCNRHPNYIGELGLAPNPELVSQVQACDLLLVIGPRLGDITTSGYAHFPLPGAGDQSSDSSSPRRLVHVHIAPEEINRVFTVDLGIVSQPAACLRRLCETTDAMIAGPKNDGNPKEWMVSLKTAYQRFIEAPRFTDAAVRMDEIAAFLRGVLPPDAIITNGAGNYTTWTQRHYQFSQYGTQLATTNGSMGYGVPAAVAAKLVCPDQMVVSFSGDGCFLMNGQELATAVQYRLKILFLVINNGTFGTIEMHQRRRYPDRPIATALENPDFAALAQAYGAFGDTVNATSEFESIYRRAQDHPGPALIDIKTDYF